MVLINYLKKYIALIKSKLSNNSEHVVIDTLSNAIDSINTACMFISKKHQLKWKWIAISMHHSLYSFCVSALYYGNPDFVISVNNDDKSHYCRKNNSSKWHESKKKKIGGGPAYRIIWLKTDEEPQFNEKKSKKQHVKLIGFWTALARVQDDFYWMGRTCNAKALVLTDEQVKEIVWLSNQVRNDIMHFIPKLYMIDIQSIKSACLIILDAIDFLVYRSGMIYIRDENEASKLKSNFGKLRSILIIPNANSESNNK